MGTLDKVRLDVAAISGRVVLARMGKDPCVALETRDAQSEFWHALVKIVGVDHEVQFGGGDEQFVVTLKKFVGEPS